MSNRRPSEITKIRLTTHQNLCEFFFDLQEVSNNTISFDIDADSSFHIIFVKCLLPTSIALNFPEHDINRQINPTDQSYDIEFSSQRNESCFPTHDHHTCIPLSFAFCICVCKASYPKQWKISLQKLSDIGALSHDVNSGRLKYCVAICQKTSNFRRG